MSIEETLAGPLRSRTEVVSAYAGAWPNITLGGVQQFAYWNSHVYADPGEAITVAREVDPSGVARNTVIGRIGRPGATEGTVVSADGATALVQAGAVQAPAAYSGITLAPGDTVRLLWQGRVVTVVAKLTAYVAPPVTAPGTTAPPPASTTGELPVFATDSATWVPSNGVWNAHAGGRQNVYQGTYGSATTYGAWFYNGATKQLTGATISGQVKLRIPRRLSVGDNNSDATIHVYVHTSDNRPGGDVSRVAGPYDFTIPANYQGGWVYLPAEVGAQLAASGGGISIAGNPYMGFVGKAEDPASGQLIIPWMRQP